MKKRLVAIISYIILIIVMIVIVAIFKGKLNINSNVSEDKIQITASLFPQYDFAKQIVGDKGEVTLLLNSGVESHNYEPTAQDMINMTHNCDLFLFNGTSLEPWTEKIYSSLEENNVRIVDLSENINLIKTEEFEEKYLNSEIAYDKESAQDEIYDEHIWLNIDNAKIMVNEILNALIEVDPENAEYYKGNANEYLIKLDELKNEFDNVLASKVRNEIVIAGDFAYAYLIDEFDLNFVSVYTTCGEGNDPSITKIKSVIDYINNHGVKYVYYKELSNGTVAKMISEETNTTPLILYSIHNGDKKQDTYISLMEKNIENLRKGLCE